MYPNDDAKTRENKIAKEKKSRLYNENWWNFKKMVKNTMAEALIMMIGN